MLFNRFALTEARNQKGMSKSALARAANHSAPYITQVEAGDRPNPSKTAVEKWCEVLGVEDPRSMYLEPSVDELLRELGVARERESQRLREAVA